MARIVQVSDSHLSPSVPYADANWAAVVDEVRRLDPDLVVHTGDISLDGANDPADLEHARRRRYSGVFGDGSWSVVLDGWRIVGIDVQTLGSSLDAGVELWNPLEHMTAGPEPIILFIHRPLIPLAQGEIDHPGRYITDPTRARISGLIDRRSVRLIGSGHVHQWRSTDHEGRRHVWAPSTWATLPDIIQPVIGTKTTGIVELTLDGTPTARLIQPDGLAGVMIGRDFPSPYDH